MGLQQVCDKFRYILVVITTLLILASSSQVNDSSNKDHNVVVKVLRKLFGLDSIPLHPPSSGIQIIGASFPRTGTSTTKAALEQLGFPTYHMEDATTRDHYQYIIDIYNASCYDNNDYLISKALNRWTNELERLGFKATVDSPAAMLYPLLMKKYPHAKVLFNYREPKSWLRSWKKLLMTMFSVKTVPLATWVLSLLGFREDFPRSSFGHEKSPLSMYPCVPREEDVIWEFNYWYWTVKDIRIDEEKCLQRYNEYFLQVKQNVPKERLLIWNQTEGWEPLVRFLNIQAPQGPLPNTNGGDSLAELEQMNIVIAKFYPLGILLIILLMSLARRCIKSRSVKLKTS